MPTELHRRLRQTPVIPLIQANDPDVAVETARALLAGGLSVVEVVLRTEAAVACLAAVAEAVPDTLVGAGTVLSEDHARNAVENGAQFIVSPGLHEDVVRFAQIRDVPVYPGIATATELQIAWNMGLRAVKFFPAGQAGGTSMIKALSSVFRDVSFIPTGGISAANLSEYLSLPSVMACGGSWLTPASVIEKSDFAEIETLAREAVEIANNSG